MNSGLLRLKTHLLYLCKIYIEFDNFNFSVCSVEFAKIYANIAEKPVKFSGKIGCH